MKTENWSLNDAERYSVLVMLYRMSSKVEEHHYPNSTVLQAEVLEESITITVPNVLLEAVKDTLEKSK